MEGVIHPVNRNIISNKQNACFKILITVITNHKIVSLPNNLSVYSGLLFLLLLLTISLARADAKMDSVSCGENLCDNSENVVENIALSDVYHLFREYDRNDAPGCAVAVYNNGDTVYSGFFGMANLDYDIALSDSSAFYMAAIAKQFTAAAAGLLVIRGALDPGKSVSHYIEEWPPWANDVRVKHLFDHTSGLPDIFELMNIAGISINDVMIIDDYISVIINGEDLKHRPGEEYSYTNSGYMVLAKIIENISKNEFSVFVNNEILFPLGMRESRFHDDRYRVIPNRVIGYAPVPDGLHESDRENGDEKSRSIFGYRQVYSSNFQGVGPEGFYSTLNDWRNWEAFWSGRKIPSAEFLNLRHWLTERAVVKGDTLEYGRGLEITRWQGVRMDGHSGQFMGFRTDVRRFPEYGVAVLTLCNRTDTNPEEINRILAGTVLRKPFEKYLKPYEGVYYNDELQVDYNIEIKDGSLTLERRLPPRGKMLEKTSDIWSVGSYEIVFTRDDTGRIKGFLLSTGRAREVEFLRK